jgi:hydroxymethylpyrimidine/phosphomethylpyrimidine kinase
VPAARLRARVDRWPPPRAIKVGLVPDELAAVVAELVARTRAPVVVDPVLRASDGGSLGATPAGLAPLLAVATLLTPNRDEALALLEASPTAPGGSSIAAPELADALGRRFLATAILLKDGHGSDPTRVVDRLIVGPRVVPHARPRLPGPDPRGTGCALATAIATRLAQAAPLDEAVTDAIAWLDQERTRSHPGPDGRAHLPDP